MTSLSLSTTSPADLKADAVVVGVGTRAAAAPRRRGRAAADKPQLALAGSDSLAGEVERAFDRRLLATLETLGATGKAGEIVKVPTGGALKAPLLVAVGLGELTADDAPSAEALRRAAGAAARALAGQTTVAFALPADDAAAVAAVAEGVLFGAYSFDSFLSQRPADRRPPLAGAVLTTRAARDKAAKAAAARAEVVAAGVHLARDLVNTPPSHLHPAELAAAIAQAAGEVRGLDVEVLDDAALRAGGYGGLIGVGQGSVHPPRLVRLAYRPRRAKAHLALVGKGITFDSGGLSLKPAAGMDAMKSDMAGAASIAAAAIAIARLGLPIAVTAYAALAENLPSGTAIRPSDVLTIFGGKTVEVLNTDAEGRLVLADALVRAGQDSPDAIVDVATLTGAQVVALGNRTSAIMANDDGFRTAVHAAAERAGEAMWPMPLPDELRKGLDSAVADIANVGDRPGGMLSAGIFLKEFVPEGLRWAHLDIAGPAYNEGEPHGYTPKGGTGVPVRTLVALAEDLAEV